MAETELYIDRANQIMKHRWK